MPAELFPRAQVSQRLKERGCDHGSDEAYAAACYAAKVGLGAGFLVVMLRNMACTYA